MRMNLVVRQRTMVNTVVSLDYCIVKLRQDVKVQHVEQDVPA
jgi:hypothetical protein